MICALYIRVSTDDQLEFSPEAQKRALIEYAKKNNYQIDEQYIFIDEGISGTSAKRRPAFMKMISAAKSKPKPFDIILVHKFDRFARSREDSVVYKSLLRRECGIKVVSITEQLNDDKFDIILEAMLEAMGEYYSLNLSEEVMKGMLEKARRGQVQSIAPYGYYLEDKQYKINEEQAAIVKRVFEMFAIDKRTPRDIGMYLNSINVFNARGNNWNAVGIRRLLKNPAYIGTLRWNYRGRLKTGTQTIKNENEWITIKNVHEPIVSKELWDSAQKRLDLLSIGNSNKRPSKYTIKHYLSGLIRCPYCGYTFVLQNDRNNKRNWQCGGYKSGICTISGGIRVDKLSDIFKETLNNDLPMLTNSEIEKVSIASENKDDEIILLERKLKSIKNKYDLAKRSFLAGIDSMEEYADNKKIIKEEENNILEQIKEFKEKRDTTSISNKVLKFIEMIDNEDISDKEKNEFLRTFIKCVKFDKPNDTFYIEYYLT